MLTKSKIIVIDSLFPNVYRIELENKMLFDIFEYNRPTLNDSIAYVIYIGECKDIYDTELNGYFYDKTDKKFYISFGGLMCAVPNSLENIPEYSPTGKISLKYSIVHD